VWPRGHNDESLDEWSYDRKLEKEVGTSNPFSAAHDANGLKTLSFN